VRDIRPVNILFTSIVFLFVVYLTGALDLAITASVIASALLFRFQSVWLFLSALIVFAFYLVTIFLSLKIKLVTDFSVSSYLLFASGLLLYFLEGQKSRWQINLPVLDKFPVDRNNLVKLGAILFFTFLVYPLTGPNFGAIFGYIAFLYLFKKSEGRYAFIVALFFLILCPFLLIAKREKVAEESAIFTYYFLVIGTFQEIIDMFRSPTSEDEPIEDDGENSLGYTLLDYRKKMHSVHIKKLKLYTALVFILILILAGIFYGQKYLSNGKKLNLNLKLFNKTSKQLPTVTPSPADMSPTPTLTQVELKDRIASDSFNLKVSVLNGTDIAGLAASTGAKLKTAGFNNVDTGNTPEAYQTWRLSIKEKEDLLIEYLKAILELKQLDVIEATGGAVYDLEIIAGKSSQ